MKLALVLLFVSLNIFAHVTPGKYTGVDANNKPCTFTVGEEWFENDTHHPFNERLPLHSISFEGVTLENATWNVGHPTHVDYTNGRVLFNHDLFQEIVPTKFGGASVILYKNPEEREEGHAPTKLVYLYDHYSKKEKSIRVECTLK